MLSRTAALTYIVLAALVGSALASNRPDLEDVPKSCRQLRAAQEKCRLDGCDVKRIEELRELCKNDSTRDKPK